MMTGEVEPVTFSLPVGYAPLTSGIWTPLGSPVAKGRHRAERTARAAARRWAAGWKRRTAWWIDREGVVRQFCVLGLGGGRRVEERVLGSVPVAMWQEPPR